MSMEFETQESSNPVPYDEPITTVALKITGDRAIHFDPVWHDDMSGTAKKKEEVDRYIATIRESLDAFVIERIRGLAAGERPEIRAMIVFRLTNQLKAHPLP
jgi:hypothetical protein